ncbi:MULTISPECIES: hypothetical protein [Oceanimonas]|uniref:Uncharacterized protein n=1 Tax=Oceanimonas smirnovii TaxID=264574 RepID=A0ABW7P3I5_9GAMM|nr:MULTISPECIES: hypothetical protein [Oceanimonas]MDV2857045.1 hypothetical protein [Oceanimonas sp. CAM02]
MSNIRAIGQAGSGQKTVNTSMPALVNGLRKTGAEVTQGLSLY